MSLAHLLDHDSVQGRFPDIIGSPYSSILDGLTTVPEGTQVKVGVGRDSGGLSS